MPIWLDQARELSERWIHRQQLLEAVAAPSDLRADLAGPILDACSWAYPFRLRDHERAAGSHVEIDVVGTGLDRRWMLVSDGAEWSPGAAATGPIIARLGMTGEQAWRLLTNNYDPDTHGAVEQAGDRTILTALLATRAIIGDPA